MKSSAKNLVDTTEKPPSTDVQSEQLSWMAASACVPGRSHLRGGLPCQDAAAAGVHPRPYLIVCDGRGSARHSELGSAGAVQAIQAQLDNARDLLEKILDAPEDEDANRNYPFVARLLYRTAAQEQRRQAERLGAVPADFEHTLLLIVCGKKRFLCLQVGDGGIVMQKQGGLTILSEPARGEFANTTFFVTSEKQTSWRHKLLPIEGITGFMAFSDGTAEKLVVTANNSPVPAIGNILEQASTGRFGRNEILHFLTETHWEPQVQDDRSLAMLTLVPPPAQPVFAASDIPEFIPDPESLALSKTTRIPINIPNPSPDPKPFPTAKTRPTKDGNFHEPSQKSRKNFEQIWLANFWQKNRAVTIVAGLSIIAGITALIIFGNSLNPEKTSQVPQISKCPVSFSPKLRPSSQPIPANDRVAQSPALAPTITPFTSPSTNREDEPIVIP